MQFNKTLSYLFVALLSLSLLTGCGGSSKETSAVENNSTRNITLHKKRVVRVMQRKKIIVHKKLNQISLKPKGT